MSGEAMDLEGFIGRCALNILFGPSFLHTNLGDSKDFQILAVLNPDLSTASGGTLSRGIGCGEKFDSLGIKYIPSG